MIEEKLYDLKQLQEIAAGSEEFIKKMVGMFLELTPQLTERVVNGVKLQDWDEVKSASHKMKPSIDMMGIGALYDTVRNIESSAKNRENLESIPDEVEKLSSVLELVYEQLKAR